MSAESDRKAGLSLPDGTQATLNAHMWQHADLLGDYGNRALRAAEVMLLVRYREELSGRVLELGCGGGRLSGYLAELADELYGLDISATMVAHCQRAYPKGTFAVGDLRDLSSYEHTRPFDAVLAPFNVLDVLDDSERRRVLEDIARLLSREGLLVMSSHNLAHAPYIPTPLQLRGRKLLRILRDAPRIPRRIRNRRRALELQRTAEDHAILVDEAHDYSILHYYIEADAQRRQLEQLGFRQIECTDLDGRVLARGERAAYCAELHYAARAPAAGEGKSP